MNIPPDVLELIRQEQIHQSGCFIPGDEYLAKLSRSAELATHSDQSGVVGYVFFYCNERALGYSYISLLGTSRDARGKGVGYGLVQFVLDTTRRRGFPKCKLEVRKDNLAALKFYERLGFFTEEDRGEKLLMTIALT